ncbi:MAG: UDP-N-acetylmuramoyl-L-alanine--D-glutamate ligase, partial [Veillonella sp.]|nr:UDP-N-acetylmuramoyl-L-alanine--D-glutamate ligase [Veillonella sp.]
LTQVMESTGLPVKVGGNIGDSLSEAAYHMPEGGYLVAELSSYQLETIKSFCPLGAIVLNVTPDHLARHKTMENYAAAKARIFMNQNPENFVVLNDDDPIVRAMKKDAHSKVLSISQHHKVDSGAYFEGNTCYAVLDGKATPVIDTEHIHIKGSHNIENILAVIALTYALGVEVEHIKHIIEQFHGVEHRLERVTTFHDVTFYIDSKATNTDSVVKALDAFDKPVILLAGGHDKMTPLEDFMNIVKAHTKEVIFMGEAADRFESVAVKMGVQHIHRAQSMKEAVALGYQLAKAGDIVLLSPACSSFDWYSCFEERGEDFKNCVRELEERG